MGLELNSDKQPYVKIAAPKFKKAYEYNREFDLTDLILFTKGQPYNHFKDLRENAPDYIHQTGQKTASLVLGFLQVIKTLNSCQKINGFFLHS